MLQHGPKSQNLTPSSHSCLTRQPPCFACALQACNCRLFIIVVWCTARQNDRSGETVKHYHNCINVLSQFRAYCTNLRQYSNRPKRGDTHDNCTDTILNFRFQLMRQKIVSTYNIATYCNRHVQEKMLSSNCFSSIQVKTIRWLAKFQL